MSENNEIKEPLNKNNKVPKLRFKGFEEDWIIVNFYNHFTYFSTNSLSWDELNYNSGDYLNLHYGIIHSKNSNLILSSSLPFINHDKLPKRFTLINEGDLILADTSEDRKDAAKGIEIINKSNAHILSGLHTIHLREKAPCTIPGFKTYYVASKSFRNFARKYCEGIKVFSIKPSLLKYTHFAYPQNKNEQFMIVDFFNEIDVKKSILEKKINILKKYKEGIEKYAYKFVENQGVSIKFSELFDNLIEKNNHNFQQYTIGKNGIKKIDEINYDISNHKVFKKFNVIVGIGINEIGINKDLEYGSVSPVYDVYNIRNLKYFDSIYVTLKEQLWKKRNFITRKSTRREFEVDKYELKKMILKVVDNKDFANVYQSITNIKKAIEILNVSFNNLKILKAYILRHMFI